MVTLQRELETLVATAKKLDAQRVDAKKRLDDLDVQVHHRVLCRLASMVTRVGLFYFLNSCLC